MDNINVLVTGAGAPGIKGTLFSLKNNFDKRPVTVVGTDMNEDVVGKYICDKFRLIPPAKDADNYLEALMHICKKEKINVLLPQNTFELELLANKRQHFETIGTNIVVASKTSIDIANDKYYLMQTCRELGVPVGDFYKVSTYDDLIEKSKALGWPSKNVVVKPPISNGMRGVRIISELIDRKKMFYEEKPNSLYTTMEDLNNVLGNDFPELIVTEYLPGEEYTIDVFKTDMDTVVIPRVRHQVRSGITFSGETVYHEELIEYCKSIAEKLEMENCFGFQFKLDENGIPKILESNPRIQGTMVLATLADANIIYASVKRALGETVPKFDIKWGTKFLRYWGGVGIADDVTLI